MSRENLGPALARAVFPGVQGGPHENLIAAKAVAFREALLHLSKYMRNRWLRMLKLLLLTSHLRDFELFLEELIIT